MSVNLKYEELYQKIGLFNEKGVKIGEAEVELQERVLWRLFIYPPYQKSYSTQAIDTLLSCYDVKEVRCDGVDVEQDDNSTFSKAIRHLKEAVDTLRERAGCCIPPEYKKKCCCTGRRTFKMCRVSRN